MVKYKTKDFKCENSTIIQKEMKKWVESRDHITIVSTNIWVDDDMTYSFIVYTENNYNL